MKKLLLMVSIIAMLAGVGWAQPTITNFSPSKNAINVAADANIQITFSEDMNALNMIQPNNSYVHGSLRGRYSVAISYDGAGRILTINPDSTFLPNETITVTLLEKYNNLENNYTPRQSFSFTVATANGAGKGYFTTSTSFGSIASSSYSMTFGDLDKDGDLDAVALSNNSDNFYVLRKTNGSDAYTVSTAYSIGGGVNFKSIFLRDMDNDNDLDIVLGTNPGSGLPAYYIYENNGVASFTLNSSSNPTQLLTNNNYYAFAADWNSDGLSDVFTVADDIQGLWPFYQNTLDNFSEGSAALSSIKGRYAISADFNNDNNPDFVVVKRVSSNSVATNDSVGIVMSTGSGTFTKSTLNFGGNYDYPWGIDVADFNGDGYLDIVVNADSLFIFNNNQNGTFTKRRIANTFSNENVKTGDLNGDGYIDIAILSSTMTFLFNDGGGNFTSSYSVSRGYSGLGADLGDADGDGDLDVIWSVNGTIYVHKNNTLQPPSQSASVGSFTKNWGSQVTVNWSGGNGGSTLVIAKQGSAVDASPVDNTIYTANDTFGSGTEITTGNFVVYSGSGSSAIVKGLSTSTTYHFKVIEFNNAGSLVAYRTTVSTGSVTTGAVEGIPFDAEPGKALYYNGSSYSYMSSDGIGNTFTVEMWVKPGALNADQNFMTYGNEKMNFGINATNQFYISHENDGVTTKTITGSTTASINQWYHIAVTGENGGNMTLYVNGTSEGSTALSNSSIGSDTWWPGTDYAENKYFTGTIDEMRHWSVVRTPSEIRSNMFGTLSGFGTNVVSYWQMNEGTGNTSVDQVNSKSLTVNTGSWVTSDVPMGNPTVNNATSVTSSATAGNVSLSLSGNPFDSAVDVYVSELSTSPNTFPSGFATSLGGKYFVIQLFGTPGDFSADITLTLGSGAFTEQDATPLSNLKLYKRDSNATGVWTSVGTTTAANATTGEITFSGITSFSQFIVVEGEPYDLIQLANNSDVPAIKNTTFSFASSFFNLNDNYVDTTLDISIAANPTGTLYLDANANSTYDAGTDTRILTGSKFAYTPSGATALRYISSTLGHESINVTLESHSYSDNVDLDFMVVEGGVELQGTSETNAWYLLSSHFTDAIGTFLSSIWTQGAENSDAPAGGANLFTYSDNTASWSAVTGNLNATSMSAGQGLLAYIYADDNPLDGQAPVGGGWPKTLTANGSAVHGNSVSLQARNVDLNANGTDGSEGWSLIGNPFGWSLAADSLVATVRRGDSEASVYAYKWNTTGNAWVTMQTGEIKPFESVFVRVMTTATTVNMTLDAADKFSAGAKVVQDTTKRMVFNLAHAESGLTSTSSFQLGEKGSPGIDPYDAFYLAPLSNSFAQMVGSVDGHLLSINNLPMELEQEIEIPLYVDATVNGDFTLTWDSSELPDDWKFELKEVHSGITINLAKDSEFSFRKDQTAKISSESPFLDQNRIQNLTESGADFVLKITPAHVNTSIENPWAGIPNEVELMQSFPNPFNPTTTIQYGVPEQSKVRLEVYDVLGRSVGLLVNEVKSAGRYSISFDAHNLASGMYLYRLSVGNKIMTKRMTLIK